MKEPSQLYQHLNQVENPRHRYACTIYSLAINLYFNTWLKLEQNDIDTLVESCIRKWLLNTTYGWDWNVMFKEVYNYIIDKFPQVKYKKFNKNDQDYVDYLNKGYMVRIWMQVNKAYSYDSQDDWIVEEQDYSKLKANYDTGDIVDHFTNIYKWVGRFKWWDVSDKTMIWDSYFWRKKFNQYEVWWTFRDILMPTCYIIYTD